MPMALRLTHARRLRAAVCLAAFLCGMVPTSVLAASERAGQVTFGGVAVPGATVTATQGDKTLVTTTDPSGAFTFADLSDGVWSVKVEMIGFEPAVRDITVGSDTSPVGVELALLTFDEITKSQPTLRVDNTPLQPQTTTGRATNGQPAAAARGGGFQRAEVTSTAPSAQRAAAQAAQAPAEPPPPSEAAMGAADGLLINGSVTNGAASPFAQAAAFGNNRRTGRSLYTGSFDVIAGSSVFDATPASVFGRRAEKQDYSDLRISGSLRGPIKIPGLVTNGPMLFVNYGHFNDNNATASVSRVPTLLERSGNFSQHDAPIVDPLSGQPFEGNQIPDGRISPQAASLLNYYPAPNFDAPGLNFQQAMLSRNVQDNLQTQITPRTFGRNQVVTTFAFQRMAIDSTTLLGFKDTTTTSNINSDTVWSRRFSQFLTFRFRYQYTRNGSETMPFFANRLNVSGLAGVTGNDQSPENWGPPLVSFASGIAPLFDANYARNTLQTHGTGAEGFLVGRGRHNFQFGGNIRKHLYDIRSQQDPRGGFTFTGRLTGYDVADFLLGLPQTSSIASGNADKGMRGMSMDAYVTDDWRLSPGLTLNLGVRWEYESPYTEVEGRLVNLDVAPDFTAASPVLASDPTGTVTGADYPRSLVEPDYLGIQPRVAMAWRPVAGSSLVVRAGYGIYRNTNVFQQIGIQMAQQPPLSMTYAIQSTPQFPLTLANGFFPIPGLTTNTFAIDPNFQVGFAQTWQASVQRDLPASLTVLGTYTGTKGSQLLQAFLPNTYPNGAENPCVGCPSGFIYLTSGGESLRHAGSLQVRRRLRNGVTATVQYTLAKSEDDAAVLAGSAVSARQAAQDWRDLDAEWAPSNFDQRHQLTAQFQYTTGVGVAGGALVGGVRGALFKNWTIAAQMTTGSGTPFTPIVVSPARGTGLTGTVRASTTGASTDAPDGYYANPGAYSAPGSGQWGDSGRNSLTGPSQFNLNTSISRTFPWGSRVSLEWRLDATNVLNRVTYSTVENLVTSQYFGLPSATNPMRKIQSTVRLRF
jgi:hypothetical protein